MKGTIIFILLVVFGASAYPSSSRDDSVAFVSLWQKIQDADNNGLPKTALALVDQLYSMAKIENNSPQVIKALLHHLKYQNQIGSVTYPAIIAQWQKELKTATFPATALMHSMMAQMYWNYFEQNRWKFRNRSTTVEFKNDSIDTWPAALFVDKVIREFNLSVKEAAELQKVPIEKFDLMLEKGTSECQKLRPTLYDFLCHQAIDFFSNQQPGMDKPIYEYVLDNDSLLMDAQAFVAMKTTTRDTLSFKVQTVRMLQNLYKFRLNDTNKAAFIFLDADRLQQFHTNSVVDTKDSLYLRSLQRLIARYGKMPAVSYPMYLEAKYHNELGEHYDPMIKKTAALKWEKKRAMELCEKVVKLFSGTYGSYQCKALIENITQHNCSTENEEFVYPGQNFPIKITYKNVPKLYYRIIQIADGDFFALNEYNRYYGDSERTYQHILKTGKEVARNEQTLPISGDFAMHSTELLLKELPLGKYYILFSENEEFSLMGNFVIYNKLQVTTIGFSQVSYRQKTASITVVDRLTGLPKENAKVTISKLNPSSKVGELSTDYEGKVDVFCGDGYWDFMVEIELDGQKIKQLMRNLYFNNVSKELQRGSTIFTDRAIYRPGQTVYFKGIVYNTNGDSAFVIKNSPVHVEIKDVNWQRISSTELTSNDFGSFNGTFTIPRNILNGQMTISNGYTTASFQVEEYKRPKFQVTMNAPSGTCLLGKEVIVKGSALTFAGSVLTGAKVSYKITRQNPRFDYWWFPVKDDKLIARGVTETNEKGEIIIKFVAEPDKSLPRESTSVYSYTVSVDVTDVNGETQSTETMVNAGCQQFYIATNVVEKQNINQDMKIDISVTNANNQPSNATGSVTVYSLIEPEMPLRTRLWERGDTVLYSKDEWQKRYPNNEYSNETHQEAMPVDKKVFQSAFDTRKSNSITVEGLLPWGTGRFKIVTSAIDSLGNSLETIKYVSVYDPASKSLPFATPHFFGPVKTICKPGEKAQLLIGSSNKIRAILEIERQGVVIKKEWINLNNEQRLLEIPITENDRGNISANIHYVYDGRWYEDNQLISVPRTNKELSIKFETFRNNLQPGQKERWTLSVAGDNSKKVAAEMMATLYDASLENFVKHQFSLGIYNNYEISFNTVQYLFDNNYGIVENNEYAIRNYIESEMIHNQLNWFGLNDNYYYGNRRYYNEVVKVGYGTQKKTDITGAVTQLGGDDISERPVVGVDQAMMGVGIASAPMALKSAKVMNNEKREVEQIKPLEVSQTIAPRTNLSELAFFYPTLYTNDSGMVTISFTIPEALTTWRMLGMAHTKDMSYGFVENSLQTQKELMVMPNPPRFLRESDTIEFPVKVSNLTDKKLAGTAQLQLFDAFSMSPLSNLLVNTKDKQAFSVDAKGNAVVLWKMAVPEGVEAITWRATADCGTFADGEENSLPVLSNRMLVTETMPLVVSHRGTKTFTMEKLKNNTSTTLKTRTYTLEFTSNPAWYAVQALPYLMEYPYECAEQTFSRFYANSLASHIANSSPRIKQVFDQWASAPDSKALLSKLEKNQDLKSILLQETPWVLESQDQAERQKRVALLFDLNRMSAELSSALKKLQDMQKSSGGWPWFPGMDESRYITQHIVCGIGHLVKLGVLNLDEKPEVKQMTEKAIEFVDEELKRDYERLKKSQDFKGMAQNYLGWDDVQYLYLRSFFTQNHIPEKTKEAYNFYMAQAEKYWLQQSRYGQGLIALALYRFGKKDVTNSIVTSIREHAMQSEEIGMYWKEQWGWYWYEAPIETQSLMIELFADATKDTVAVNEMKLWLLKQKQTQDWKTTKATTEAVYALLLQGNNWLDNTKMAEIKVGSQIINPTKLNEISVEAGTGYFRTLWTGSDVKPEMATITVTNPNQSPAWGAVYWQYFENLDKITPAETPLKLSRKFFVEEQTDAGAVIRPLVDTASLKVGDKVIVRIELRCDRAMEFVHMKDMRASGLEPINVISSYKWQDGLGYYESTKDASTNFFMDRVRPGTYVFEYPLRVAQRGAFSCGTTSIQCMYAPEFSSHSEGTRVRVK